MNSTQFKKELVNLRNSIVYEINSYLVKNKASEIELNGTSLFFGNPDEQFSDVLSGIKEDVVIIATEDDTYEVKYDEITLDFMFAILEKLEKNEFELIQFVVEENAE